MEKTPLSLRTHITIFGNTNSGKSALFNKLIGQDMMIVSDTMGTTTDPVTKAMELIPYGPVAITDTAGWGDCTGIGHMRQEKTDKMLDRTDFAIYTADSENFDVQGYKDAVDIFTKKRIPFLVVFTKTDLGKDYSSEYPQSVGVSVNDDASVEALRNRLVLELSRHKREDRGMIDGLVGEGGTVVLVIPIDSEAPKGRLILPQVQLIRNCLDNGITAVCARDTELVSTLGKLAEVDLVVTDSQAFKSVDKMVPEGIKLTSFSMLLANQKGDIETFAKGAEALENLKDGSKILMAEACTHNASHEDIGRVKIPNMLKKYTGKDLDFQYSVYHDFPDNLSEYDLVIHCGGCMISDRTMENRMYYCREAGVPITNYGVVISYVNGILKRSMEIFR